MTRKVIDLGAVRESLARLDALARERPEAFARVASAAGWEAILQDELGAHETETLAPATRLRALRASVEALARDHPEALENTPEGRAEVERFAVTHRAEIRMLLAAMLCDDEDEEM